MVEGDEGRLVIRRILRNGRRRYDAASKARLVAASLERGVSVSRLALDNGINANLLRKWIKQAKEAGGDDRRLVTLSIEQLHWILDGIDIDAMVRHPVRQYQVAG